MNGRARQLQGTPDRPTASGHTPSAPMRSKGSFASLRRSLVPLVLVAIAFALAPTSASAALIPAGEITGPAAGVAFGALKSESVAVSDFDGHIYVADSSDGKVYDFSSVSDTAPAVWEGLGGASVAVAVQNSTGDVYVSDSADGLIRKFEADGTPITTWGEGGQLSGPETGVLFSPAAQGSFGIAVDQASGDLYAIDAGHKAIDVFSEAGALLETLAAEPDAYGCGGAYADGISVNDADSELLLSTSCSVSSGLPTAYRLSLAGALLERIDGSETPAHSLGNGFASVTGGGANGHIFATDTQHSVVDEFGSTGTYLGQLTGLPTGSFSGLAVDPANGTLYVADGGTGTVKLFVEPAPGPPTITSASVVQVSSTSAELRAEIDPHLRPTTYHFEYGLSDCSLAACSRSAEGGPISEGSTDISVSLKLFGLAPGTVYHYRVVAENIFGPATSPDQTFTTQGPAASLLADGRGWELVSPPNKHGSPLLPIDREGGVIQASADGRAITYIARGPIVADPAGNRGSAVAYNQELSSREGGSWVTSEITTQNEEVAEGLPGKPAEYRFFSENLSLGIVEPGVKTPLSPEASERTPYIRQPDGSYQPLLTTANVDPGTKFGKGTEFIGSSPDSGRIFLESTDNLAPGVEGGGERIVYQWSAGRITPASVLPGGEPHAGEVGTNEETSNRGAVSSVGDRIVFSASLGPGDRHLYARDLTLGESVQLDVPTPGGSSIGGIPTFQGANRDGSKIFFTDTAPLTADSAAGAGEPDLFMCEVTVQLGALTCTLKDLTVAETSEPGGVQGLVSAFSADGRFVYFAAKAALAPGASSATCAEGSETATCNLYVRDTASEETRLVGVLSGADEPDWGRGPGGGALVGLTARSSPDGRYLAFMSERSLTGYDNRDLASGQRDEEVFLYDSSAGGHLVCASCNPTGGRPRGALDPEGFPGLLVDHAGTWPKRWLASSIPGWTPNHRIPNFSALHQSRYLSNSGRLFFNSSDALVPQDSNATGDVYEFEPVGIGSCSAADPTFSAKSAGCASLISSGTSPGESAFLDASEDGADVFFLTAAQLSTRDIDSALDLYDARAGGGEPQLVTPPACEGDACQLPATPPDHPTPGTALVNGPGNVLQCPKGKVKKSGKCVKKHKAKKHHRKQSARHAKKKRGTSR